MTIQAPELVKPFSHYVRLEHWESGFNYLRGLQSPRQVANEIMRAGFLINFRKDDTAPEMIAKIITLVYQRPNANKRFGSWSKYCKRIATIVRKESGKSLGEVVTLFKSREMSLMCGWVNVWDPERTARHVLR